MKTSLSLFYFVAVGIVYGGCHKQHHDDCCHKPHHCKRQQDQDALAAFPTADSGSNFPDNNSGLTPEGANDAQFPGVAGASPDTDSAGQLPAGINSQLFPSDSANSQSPIDFSGNQLPNDGSAGLNPGSGSNQQFPNDGSTSLNPGSGSNQQFPNDGSANLNPDSGSNQRLPNDDFDNQFPNDGSAGLNPGSGSNGQTPNGGIQFPSENAQQPLQPTNDQPNAAPADTANGEGSATQSIPASLFDDLPGFLGISFPGQVQQSTTPTGIAFSTEDSIPDEPSGSSLNDSTNDDASFDSLDEESVDEESTSGTEMHTHTICALVMLSLAIASSVF